MGVRKTRVINVVCDVALFLCCKELVKSHLPLMTRWEWLSPPCDDGISCDRMCVHLLLLCSFVHTYATNWSHCNGQLISRHRICMYARKYLCAQFFLSLSLGLNAICQSRKCLCLRLCLKTASKSEFINIRTELLVPVYYVCSASLCPWVLICIHRLHK